MKLGIVYYRGNVINHRSLLKVLFNPILRYFGYYIGTLYVNDELGGIKLNKCDRSSKIVWEKYDCEYDYIVKKRTLI